MDSLCYEEEIYKKLLPVPKTHLFMKKMAKIQAIDRQIRKKWIQIKRDNQIHHLILSDNQAVHPLKKQVVRNVRNEQQFNFLPIKIHSQVIQAQNQFKRQQILSNHKRREQIFYGRKKKPQHQIQFQNLHFTPLKNLANDSLIVNFETPRKKIKTQPSIKKLTIKKSPVSEFNTQKSHTTSPQKSVELRQIISMSKSNKTELKLPKMLLKRNEHKSREIKILTSQSEKQLVVLSQKNQQNLKSWAEHRRDMFEKLKGSKAYFIMKSPTRVMESEGQPIYMV